MAIKIKYCVRQRTVQNYKNSAIIHCLFLGFLNGAAMV